jgi:hypothetical protein
VHRQTAPGATTGWEIIWAVELEWARVYRSSCIVGTVSICKERLLVVGKGRVAMEYIVRSIYQLSRGRQALADHSPITSLESLSGLPSLHGFKEKASRNHKPLNSFPFIDLVFIGWSLLFVPIGPFRIFFLRLSLVLQRSTMDGIN